MRKLSLFFSAAIACAVFGSQVQTTKAQTPEQFYKGRTIKLISGSTVGGGGDLMSRLVARFMAKHMPGQPVIAVQNLPGGGGLIGANRIANAAPRDGSEFAAMERTVPQYAVMGDANARFDPLALTWLGSLSSYRDDAYMLLLANTHPAKTVEDLRKPGISARLGASQQGSANLTLTQIARYVLDVNIIPISGYSGTSKIAIAIQSGEVDGEMIGMSSVLSTQRHMWDSKFLRPLAQFARETRHPALPDVPTARELVKDPDKLALLEFAELSFFMARPFVAPAGIPADRAKALRDAFMAAVHDPEYISESKKLEIDHSPIDHVEIERLLRKAVATPKSVIAEFEKLVNRK